MDPKGDPYMGPFYHVTRGPLKGIFLAQDTFSNPSVHYIMHEVNTSINSFSSLVNTYLINTDTREENELIDVLTSCII